jgi:hypothetical protein
VRGAPPARIVILNINTAKKSRRPTLLLASLTFVFEQKITVQYCTKGGAEGLAELPPAHPLLALQRTQVDTLPHEELLELLLRAVTVHTCAH